MKILVLFFVILVSFSWAKEKKEVEVPINIGIGPAYFWIPGIVGKELHPGVKFDLYAVITPKVLHEYENKIPKKYKKLVNMNEEMHVTPLWMSLIPKYLIINPAAENSIYGGIWSLLGISQMFLKNNFIELEAELVLPTISYLYTNAPKNDPDIQHLFGIGAMLRLENTIKFSEKFLTTLAYGHNFNLPLSNTYKEEDKAEQRWLQAGVLSLVLHYRFNIKQKI
ncbi:MAG: hypothetical protein LBC75_04615 [Fibromonadaceae bacterium]|nr:hypothetical protein [Fibromonadaceae bacterium]